MPNVNGLKKFYENKYVSDINGHDLKNYLLNRWPKNRFEASVHWAPTGKKVLDIGCGSGNLLFSLKDKFDELHGIDISKNRIIDCEKSFKIKNINNSFFKVMNADDKLDYPDNYFNFIICSNVLEHLLFVYKFFNEAYRILNTNGLLLIDVPNITKWTRRIKLLLGVYPSTASLNEGLLMYDKKTPTDLLDEGHLHNFTYKLVKNLFKKANFKIYKQYGYGKFGRIHNLFPGLLSDDVLVIGQKN